MTRGFGFLKQTRNFFERVSSEKSTIAGAGSKTTRVCISLEELFETNKKNSYDLNDYKDYNKNYFKEENDTVSRLDLTERYEDSLDE